jgi:hypothetical protein
LMGRGPREEKEKKSWAKRWVWEETKMVPG